MSIGTAAPLVNIAMTKATNVADRWRLVGEVVTVPEDVALGFIGERACVLAPGSKLSPVAARKLAEMRKDSPAPKPVEALPTIRVHNEGPARSIGSRWFATGETNPTEERAAIDAVFAEPGVIVFADGETLSERGRRYLAELERVADGVQNRAPVY